MIRHAVISVLGYGALAALLLACMHLISLAPLRLDWGRELVGASIALLAMLAGLFAARRWSNLPGSDSGVGDAVVRPASRAPPAEPPAIVHAGHCEAGPLSQRELEVLRLLCSGQSNKQIARTLQLSENTVKTHLARVYEKLGVNKRTEAIVVAQRLGLVDIRAS